MFAYTENGRYTKNVKENKSGVFETMQMCKIQRKRAFAQHKN